MKNLGALLSLPAGLLSLLLATQCGAQELAWAGDRRLQDGAHMRRDLDVLQRLQWQAPGRREEDER